MSIVLGLDLSLNSAGFFLFNTDNFEILDYGFIPNKNIDESEKILKIYNVINGLFDKYQIDGIGIEEEFYSLNPHTLKLLSRVHGASLLAIAQRKIPYVYYSVLTAKSVTLSGFKTKREDGTKKKGDELKKEVAEEIFKIFGRDKFPKKTSFDITDAASLAWTYYKKDGKPIETVKKPKKTKVKIVKVEEIKVEKIKKLKDSK